MRFVLFDRILELEKGKKAVLLKNVSQTEDFFIDHFPGYPILPGSIIIGSFEQGAEILLGSSFDFTVRPVLKSVSRASFRRLVQPGDQLEIRLALGSVEPARIRAEARVGGRKVAEAELVFSLEKLDGDREAIKASERLRALYQLLTSNPLGKVWDLWER